MVNRNCIYLNCKSNSRKNHNLQFIAFPKPKRRPVTCKNWLKACGKDDFTVKKHTFICGLHFVGGNGPTDQFPDPVPIIEANIETNKTAFQFDRSNESVNNLNQDQNTLRISQNIPNRKRKLITKSKETQTEIARVYSADHSIQIKNARKCFNSQSSQTDVSGSESEIEKLKHEIHLLKAKLRETTEKFEEAV